MPTPDLFDFDTYSLANYDPARVRQALHEHSAIYVSHLEVAQWIEGWTERLKEQSSGDDSDFVQALREVMAYLRQADLVPGGPRLADMEEARSRDRDSPEPRHRRGDRQE